MKASEFRKLIREEVRKVLKEAAEKSSAVLLRLGSNSKIITHDLKAYTKDYQFFRNGKKMSLSAALQKFSPKTLSHWTDQSDLERTRNYAQEAKELLSKFTSTHDFYDAFELTTNINHSKDRYNFIPMVAVVPKGSKLSDYARDQGYVLVIDEDGYFTQEDLAYYDFSLDLDGPKITAVKAAKLPTKSNAWADAPQLAKVENNEWLQAIAKLGTKYDYYNVLSADDGTEKAAVAAIPRGKELEDFT